MLDELVMVDPPAPVPAPLRASSYNIYVDLPGDKSSLLLVHGYTGAYDKVSREVAAFVRRQEILPVPKPLYGAWLPELSLDEPAPTPSDALIEKLRKRGFLTRKTVEEEEAYFVKHVAALRRAQKSQMPSYIVMPSYDCNLRCHYCFQDFMRRDPSYKRLLTVMSNEMADRIIGSFAEIELRQHGIEELGERQRHITFFGGEPLTVQTRPIVERFIRKTNALGNASFSAITNATQLDAYEDLLGPDGLSWLQITLDGPPEEHDKRRIQADGTGSFEAIDRNIELALAKGVTVVIRVNVDRSSIGGLPEMTRHFAERGWTEQSNFSCYVAPVHDSLGNGKRGDFYNTYELGVAIAELKDIHPEMRAITPVDYRLKRAAKAVFDSIESGMPAMTTYCGAHEGMYVFDAFGDIYACWERTGNQNIRIGFVGEDSAVTLNETSALWRERDVTSNSTCRRCRFALHCGGGCAVLAEGHAGTLYANHCDAFGKRLRARFADAFVEFQEGKTDDARGSVAAAVETFVR